jgi:hypothetical protein
MVFVFALWTVLCNFTVLLRGTLEHLLLASLVVALAAGGFLVHRKRARRLDARSRERPELDPVPAGRVPAHPPLLIVIPALLVSVALAAAFFLSDSYLLLWWATLLYLLCAFCMSWRAVGDHEPIARTSRGREVMLWILALLAACVPLFAHRGTPDDALYLNIAVSAADHPQSALLQHDSLHGFPDLPFVQSAYKVHSYEILSGAISHLSGLGAVRISHWILPSLFALFLVLAHARLLRWLAPDIWPWCIGALLAVFALLTSDPQSFGAFAFLRMHQGKGVFLCVFVPLTIVYGLRFGRSAGIGSWLRLFAIQVAGIGMTSTAIWAGPTVATLAVASGVAFSKRGLRDLLVGVAASAYCVVTGLSLRRGLMDQLRDKLEGSEGVRLVSSSSEPIQSGTELVVAAWNAVLGVGPVSALCLFAALSGWILCSSSLGRRVCVLLPLGTLVFFLNPYTAMKIASTITVEKTYWRVLWLLPIPALLTLLLAAPVRLRLPRLDGRIGAIAFAALMLTCMSWAWRREIPVKWIHWEPFGLKVYQGYTYRHAMLLNRCASPGGRVLAPRYVSTWVPTFHRHAYPLVSRRSYLIQQEGLIGKEEVERRLQLYDFVSQPDDDSGPEMLAEAIRHYGLEAVCFVRLHRAGEAIRSTLSSMGFQLVESGGNHETWARKGSR